MKKLKPTVPTPTAVAEPPKTITIISAEDFGQLQNCCAIGELGGFDIETHTHYIDPEDPEDIDCRECNRVEDGWFDGIQAFTFEEFFAKVMKEAKEASFTRIIATHTDRAWDKPFEDAGWTKIDDFKSNSTGNHIKVWMKDVPKVKSKG